MSWFPQIGGGSIAQFPLSRSRQWRAISNELESGERISLPDPRGGSIAWTLSYQDLTDAEILMIQSLFVDSGGRCKPFSFIDPMVNLFGWSEDLSRPDWQAGQLQLAGGVNDPLGTARAWSVTNSSAADQSLTQTVEVPGEYMACFSVWLKSYAPLPVTLSRDSHTQTVTAGTVWKQFRIAGVGAAGTTHSTLSLRVPAASAVQVWGLQVEAQPWSSQYKKSGVPRGIYAETYFAADDLRIVSVGAGRSSCDIALVSRV